MATLEHLANPASHPLGMCQGQISHDTRESTSQQPSPFPEKIATH